MKQTVKRLLALVLCAAMLLPLIPAATAVTAEAKGLSKSQLPPYVKEAPAAKKNAAVFTPNAATIRAKSRPVRDIGGGDNNGNFTTYTFETFEDLKTLAAGTYGVPTDFTYIGSDSVFTISENLTLPDNTFIYVYVKTAIPAGITFTLSACNWGSYFNGLEVNGVLNANGFVEVNQSLTVNGRINLGNNMALNPDTAVSGLENIVPKENWYEVYYWHYISTDSELHDALAKASADTSGLHHDIYFQAQEDVTFSKSFTVPANARVSLQNGVTYSLPSGKTITVNGTVDMYSWSTDNPVLKIAGTLVNNGGFSIAFETFGSHMLVFTDTGKYSGSATLQIQSYGAPFTWTDVISGLDISNLEVSEGENWCDIRDVSNLIKLSAPKNLAWHKTVDWATEEIITRKGAVSWEGGEVKDTSSDYQYYYVQLYKDGEPFYWFRWGFSDYYEENSLPCNIDASVNVTEEEWESGTYYFTVQAIPNPDNANSEYRNSDIVTSATWTYTKPSSLSKPTKLTWNWPSMSWSGPSGHKYYDLEIQYAPTLEDEFQYVYGACYEMGNNYTLGEYALKDLAEYWGAGYYRFKVRSLSTDITAKYHSAWSAYSDTYYFDGKLELTAPTLTASNIASTGKIKLSWNKVDGAAKYQVYRATSKNGTYSLLKTTTGTSLTNTSAEVGKTYYYKVRAVDADGNKSEFSDVVNRTCDLPRPEVTVTNVASSGKIKLTWNKVEGAAKYEVYRATSKNGTYSLLKTTTGTSLTNTSAKTGIQYYYKVRAIHSKSSANSAYSEIVTRICDLARPVVKATNVASSGKIKLSWEKVEGAVKYEVYRATSKTGTYSKLITTTSTSVTNTSATAGKTYYYKVRAIHEKSAANSAYSSVVSRTCDLARPTAKVSLNSKGKPVISWGKVEGAVKYTVYIYDANGNLLKTTSTTNLKITHSSAVKGTTYKYQVVAVHSNSAANSAKSATVSIKSK